MAIKEHPDRGTIVMCNFDTGFIPPEMVKKRPVIILSPKIKARKKLATVVVLSTTPPHPIMPYHVKIDLPPPALPKHFTNQNVWVKGDMVYTVSLDRLDFFRLGRKSTGERLYYYSRLDLPILQKVFACVLHGIGLSNLTKFL